MKVKAVKVNRAHYFLTDPRSYELKIRIEKREIFCLLENRLLFLAGKININVSLFLHQFICNPKYLIARIRLSISIIKSTVMQLTSLPDAPKFDF